jgi:hypothetical protein
LRLYHLIIYDKASNSEPQSYPKKIALTPTKHHTQAFEFNNYPPLFNGKAIILFLASFNPVTERPNEAKK